MFNLREVIKMSIDKTLEMDKTLQTEKEKRKLIEQIAYEHAKKYNYPYINYYGHY